MNLHMQHESNTNMRVTALKKNSGRATVGTPCRTQNYKPHYKNTKKRKYCFGSNFLNERIASYLIITKRNQKIILD